MTTYTITHGTGNDTPGTITFTAYTDAAAIRKVRRLVEQGQRNEAWAEVSLVDGRLYRATNSYGKVTGNGKCQSAW